MSEELYTDCNIIISVSVSTKRQGMRSRLQKAGRVCRLVVEIRYTYYIKIIVVLLNAVPAITDLLQTYEYTLIGGPV